jgi:hypothetical protein
VKSRRHLDRPSRDTWRDPIPSQNRELDEQRKLLSTNSDTRYRDIPRRLLSRPSQRTGGSRSTNRQIDIRGFVKETHRNSRNDRYREDLSRPSSWTSNIVAPSHFGKLSRSLSSQLAKSRYAKSR